MPHLRALDHLVLTVADIPATIAFYSDVLGMQATQFQPSTGPARWALMFGAQKINLHEAKSPFAPHAKAAVPGSADLCFLSDQPVDTWLDHFKACGVAVIAGPVPRSGATGPIISLYLRDPDGNLIEVAQPA